MSVKLTYFNLRGRGEPCRVLLAYGGIKWEDERIPPPWDPATHWPAVKPKTPFGQLPLLTWEGETISQSMACSRFLAKKVGLAGRTDLEQAQADEIVDVVQDLINTMASLYFAKDEEGMKKFTEVTRAAALANLEKKLESRGGQHFAGNALTWADTHVFLYLSEQEPGLAQKYPKLADLKERVGNIPNIKAWVESRPKTDV